MNSFIQVLQLTPTIIGLVKAAEGAVPGAGNGKAKLDFVLGLISDVVGNVSSMLPAITQVVARIVALFNKTGQFQTTAKA